MGKGVGCWWGKLEGAGGESWGGGGCLVAAPGLKTSLLSAGRVVITSTTASDAHRDSMRMGFHSYKIAAREASVDGCKSSSA